jgi:2-keto-4-pentenoate hydratase/2-oxohepta-3-ene-1,7-dioic acid hydratase in catechol pathway
VTKPRWTDSWDYENELAVVIGRACVDVPPESAYDVVFGYTIMNDLSARDVQMAERKEGNICIGKNFPTAAPLGPWIVTKDEIPDPHALRIVTRINGQVRQDSTTDKMIYHIPAQVAWYSHAGFEPGDVISTGTPSGVGLGYKGPGTWYLQHGDRMECEVEGIGVLINTCRDPSKV